MVEVVRLTSYGEEIKNLAYLLDKDRRVDREASPGGDLGLAGASSDNKFIRRTKKRR